MRTIKRNVSDLYGTIENNIETFNQMEWDGIVEDKNPYTVSQNSLSIAENIYVNSNGHLTSRFPIKTNEVLSLNKYESIVEVKDAGDIRVFVILSGVLQNKYEIGYYKKSTGYVYRWAGKFVSENRGLYRHKEYILWFTDEDAYVLNLNDIGLGFKPISSISYIPIKKLVKGSSITSPETNILTDSYREKYVFQGNEFPTFLNDYTTSTLTIIYDGNEVKYELRDSNKYPDYRSLKPLTYKLNARVGEFSDAYPVISTVDNIIALAYDEYFMLSLNRGRTFSKIAYPIEAINDKPWSEMAGLTKDGRYFFTIMPFGAYRYSLSDNTWTRVSLSAGYFTRSNNSLYNGGYFLNSDNFAYATNRLVNQNYEYKFVSMLKGNLSILSIDSDPYSQFNSIVGLGYARPLVHSMIYDTVNDKMSSIVSTSDSAQSYGRLYILSDDEKLSTQYIELSSSDKKIISIIIDGSNIIYSKPGLPETSGVGIEISGKVYMSKNDNPILDKKWYKFSANIFYSSSGDTSVSKSFVIDSTPYQLLDSFSSPEPPVNLSSSIIKFTIKTTDDTANSIFDVYLYDSNGNNGYSIPSYIGKSNRNSYNQLNSRDVSYFVSENYYCLRIGDELYVNNFNDEDIREYDFLFSSDNPFIERPTAFYSDSEIYIAFGKDMYISSNSYEKDENTGIYKLLLCLPELNKNSFESNVNDIINISTSEVAVFMNDAIFVCSMVEDENFGIRYDYRKTRLSLGIREGDRSINSLDGAYTIYPSRRGLLAMTYQEFMASSDQVIKFLTDPIEDVWTEFYDNGDNIRILQRRNKLYLSNSTNTILVFDMSGKWWIWNYPIKVIDMITDQTSLELVSERLHEINITYNRYMDFYSDRFGKYNKIISWSYISQPLHLNAPNNYKNLKQIIFNSFSNDKSILDIIVQIKIYRDAQFIKKPDVLSFTIDVLGSFVKRFNYWKANYIQIGLMNNSENSNPKRLFMNGLTIKYEIGDPIK